MCREGRIVWEELRRFSPSLAVKIAKAPYLSFVRSQMKSQVEAQEVLGGGAEEMRPVSLDELESLLEAGAELIDVRERDERDTGYIAGSRNIPYRLLGVCGADVPTDRPVVTICESGARAAIAASILAAKGVDARPVVDGGVSAWSARGGHTVEFRRCGN